ncbi:MAG: acyltransferase [Hyphomicrobiales bacterium]
MSGFGVVVDGTRRVLRRDGPGAVWMSFVHFMNGRRQLRGATEVGAVRLKGRAVVHNRGVMRFGDRIRLNGSVFPLQFTCGPGGCLEIGDGTFINYGCDISASRYVSIGRRCNIGQFAIIIDDDYHDIDNHMAPGKVEPVIIEDDVWLGARVVVLRGSHIGRGAVVAAHAVVTGEVPPYSVVAGVPARVVRMLRDGGGQQS